jgi:type IV fimbrial biogenesis protein FimT
MHRKPTPKGFTVIELMVVLTMAGILLAMALPGMRNILQAQQLKSMSFDLTADLILARSEALKRNSSVTVMPAGSSWNQGWHISVDVSGLRLAEREAGSSEVIFVSAPDRITFDANGRVTAPNAQLRQTLTTSDASATPRCVALDLSGRAQSSRGACT